MFIKFFNKTRMKSVPYFLQLKKLSWSLLKTYKKIFNFNSLIKIAFMKSSFILLRSVLFIVVDLLIAEYLTKK